MDVFESDGVEIAYLDQGDGDPVLLVHGFASNHAVNWVHTRWVRVLRDAGFRVIAVDNRGHGRSEKLYDPEEYAAPVMADDAARLLGHLGIDSAHVMGYSMGARIGAFLTLNHSALVRSAVFGGLGINMVRGFDNAEAIASALLAPSSRDITDGTGRLFRQFAESTGNDLRALSACIRSSRQKITPGDLAGITRPVLVAVGTQDDIGGDPEALASLIPGAVSFSIAGRDHMRAVGDRTYKARVLSFFQGGS